jgi:hypothetical protein
MINAAVEGMESMGQRNALTPIHTTMTKARLHSAGGGFHLDRLRGGRTSRMHGDVYSISR